MPGQVSNRLSTTPINEQNQSPATQDRSPICFSYILNDILKFGMNLNLKIIVQKIMKIIELTFQKALSNTFKFFLEK